MPSKVASKPAKAKPRARKPNPLTLYGDTSKPGGQTIKALFEAAGHTVIDRKATPHDKPAKRSVQDERITRIEQDASARDLCIGKLQTRVDDLQAWADMTATDMAQDMQGHRLARIWRRIVGFFA